MFETFAGMLIQYFEFICSRVFEKQPKFAVISVKRRQKAGFLGLISFKITLKERRTKKSEKEESMRREKKQWLHSQFL